MYERLVLKAMQDSKLEDVKRNMMVMQGGVASDAVDDVDRPPSNASDILPKITAKTIMADSYKPAEKAISESQAAARLDLYTPKVSTWGIFPRAKDISKAYGGGKTLPLPDKYPKSSLKEGQEEVDQFYTESQRIESVNAVKIKDALVRSRNLMQVGSRQKAVALLEGVKDLCSLQTGGEIWLELGMALETTGRSEESRKIYAELAVTCWNDKIKRNSRALLVGLEMMDKIKLDPTPPKPLMDSTNMASVSAAFAEGLKNPWDDWKSKDYKKWDPEARKRARITRVGTLADAYRVLGQQIDPLFEVEPRLLAQALRKFYQVPEAEKSALMREQLAGELGKKPQYKHMRVPNQKMRDTYTERVSNKDGSTSSAASARGLAGTGRRRRRSGRSWFQYWPLGYRCWLR
ncbi:hypothetical protein B484DRAFT_197869 [Ochromonadaceae sp. CCMP2298]|nr:hypothetical protein B484DRAFT_197869 [Ochromonadaceae sp. CCMP2298]